MDQFILDLSTSNIRRNFSFPLRLSRLGYLPEDFHNTKALYRSVDFSFRLSGRSPKAIIATGGITCENQYPNALLNLPNRYYETYTPQPWETLFFTYNRTLLPVIEQYGLDKFHPTWEFASTDRIINIIKDIFELSGRIHEYGVCDQLDVLAYQMILETVLGNPNSNQNENLNELNARRIASYIELHYAENLNLGKLISRYPISPRTFFRVWKNIFNMPPYEYIMNLKIKHACRMLKTSLLRVYEIAEYSGFSDPLYFSRIFKNKTGLSPREYRKKSPPVMSGWPEPGGRNPHSLMVRMDQVSENKIGISKGGGAGASR